MDTRSGNPELSVVIPVLNEAALLPGLLDGLALQRDVALEIIIVDGGSADGSREMIRRLGRSLPFPLTLTETEAGRGRQLNRGAAAGRGEYLLFLHADSSFHDPTALRTGLDTLVSAESAAGGRVAGKFRLRFNRTGTAHAFGYYFYESKASLVRRECTHGDQGILLSRSFFRRAGPFDESFPMLAETLLAGAIHSQGRWLLLPAEIHASARRFETEGLRERQTLNAIIMNFAAMNWQPFFREFPGLYIRQDKAGPLPLRSVLCRIGRLLASLPLRERLSIWSRTGKYVRGNAWQLAFAADLRRSFRKGLPPGGGPTPLLDLHDRFFDRLTDHLPVQLLTSLFVWLWFRGSCAGFFLSKRQ